MQSYISVTVDSRNKHIQRKIGISENALSLGERRRARCKEWCRKVIKFLCSQVGVGLLLLGYTCFGAVAFVGIESPAENRRLSEVSTLRGRIVQELWNTTKNYNLIHGEKWREEIETAMARFQESIIREIRLYGYDGSSTRLWTFPSALMFSLSVYTTIGYGHLVPRTKSGKVMTIFYAILGIPLCILYMANIGDLLATSLSQFYSSLNRCRLNIEKARENRLQQEQEQEPSSTSPSKTTTTKGIRGKDQIIPRTDQCEKLTAESKSKIETIMYKSGRRKEERGERVVKDQIYLQPQANIYNGNPKTRIIPISTCLGIFILYITFGSILFSWYEGWNYFDGSYFCFITLVTIGFGMLFLKETLPPEQSSNLF